MIMRLLARLRGMPSCAEVMEVLQAYLDGEVDAAEARRVAGHLAACTPCHHESMVYEEIKLSLSARRRPIDPEVLRAIEAFGRDVASGTADER